MWTTCFDKIVLQTPGIQIKENPFALRWLTPMSATVCPSKSKVKLYFKAQNLGVWCDIISWHTQLIDSGSAQMHADRSFWKADWLAGRQSVRTLKKKKPLNEAQTVDDQTPNRETKDSLVKPHQEMLTGNGSVPHWASQTLPLIWIYTSELVVPLFSI